MTPHVHVGVVEALTVVAYVLLFTLLWRVAAARLAEKHPNLSGAMAASYS